MSWLHRVLGKDGSSQLGVESTHFAARVSGRPMQIGTRGAYSIGLYSGVLPAGLGANSEIMQFRWADVSRKCLIRSIAVSAAVSTTAFIAGVPLTLEARVARSWSGQGTGGSGVTFGVNDCKKRTDFATSLLASGDVRIATTAALGAGTKTLDGQAFGIVTSQPGTAIATIIPYTLIWQRNTHDEYPQLFEQSEGFVIRSVEVPGTGTWKATVQVEWIELDPLEVEGWT
jgi:hypothetical protein